MDHETFGLWDDRQRRGEIGDIELKARYDAAETKAVRAQRRE